jgi:hypothetical protein
MSDPKPRIVVPIAELAKMTRMRTVYANDQGCRAPIHRRPPDATGSIRRKVELFSDSVE